LKKMQDVVREERFHSLPVSRQLPPESDQGRTAHMNYSNLTGSAPKHKEVVKNLFNSKNTTGRVSSIKEESGVYPTTSLRQSNNGQDSMMSMKESERVSRETVYIQIIPT